MDEIAPQHPSPTAPTSLASRLMNVFAAPGEVFGEIKSTRTTVPSWLVPIILNCLIGIIYSVVVFSQENVIHSLRETQEQEMQKQVAAGKMTQQQADQARQVIDQFMGPGMMKILGSFGAVVGSFGFLFLAALMFFLLGADPSSGKLVARWIGAILIGLFAAFVTFQKTGGLAAGVRLALAPATLAAGIAVVFFGLMVFDKFNPFGGTFSYMKAVEITALSTMITALGGIVAMLLAVTFGNPAITPGPAVLVREFNAADKLHLLLSQLNVMTMWFLAVLSVGLSKISGASFAKSAAWMFGLWLALVLLTVLAR